MCVSWINIFSLWVYYYNALFTDEGIEAQGGSKRWLRSLGKLQIWSSNPILSDLRGSTLFFFTATPVAYGSPRLEVELGAMAASPYQSHSKEGSKACL